MSKIWDNDSYLIISVEKKIAGDRKIKNWKIRQKYISVCLCVFVWYFANKIYNYDILCSIKIQS